jgi:hypothetical protein
MMHPAIYGRGRYLMTDAARSQITKYQQEK